MFWMFVALLTKSGLVEGPDVTKPGRLLETCMKFVAVLHPLLYDRIQKVGVGALQRPPAIILSLYAEVLTPPRLSAVWIAALASGEPLVFFGQMMAMGLIMVFPVVLDAEDVAAALDAAVDTFFEGASSDLLISQTLKLREAFLLND
jgi:hypothetical protein